MKMSESQKYEEAEEENASQTNSNSNVPEHFQ